MQIPRSWLFVPGDNSRMMTKALASGADALILDLEDAVASDAKPIARETVARFLEQKRPIPCFVRVNALDSGLTMQDLAALGQMPDGFVLPKCQSPDDIGQLAQKTGDLPILAIATETVLAVRTLLVRDWSHPALLGLAWGGEDLAADLGATANRDQDGAYLSPFRFARDAMLFAAKAAGVAAVDAVYTDFRDQGGLKAETLAAAAVGFTSKLAIHPAQIATIHAGFAPTEAQIDWAQRVIDAMSSAGSGVAKLDGEMLDQPHLNRARDILSRAQRQGQ